MFIRRNCGGGDFSVNSRFRGTTFNTLAAPPAATPVTESTCAQAAAIPDGGAGLGCAINNSLNRSIAVTARARSSA
ncbi:MAG: hypothetical protein IPJ85_03505 [Flavobacteriales bacterium]|nr:hypothetical protein [Flavobacteriales bacterium]